MREKTKGEKPMQWLDYTIDQFGKNFIIKGDWPGEVMDKNKNGEWEEDASCLFKPGDRFIVSDKGMLVRSNPEDFSNDKKS
jgi:hypothetical protein